MWALDDPRFVRETIARSADYKLSHKDSLKESEVNYRVTKKPRLLNLRQFFFACEDKMDLLGIDGGIGFERSAGLTSMKVSGSAKYLQSKARTESAKRT